MCKLGVLWESLQQYMWGVSGFRDWFSNACTSVERSIEVRVNHITKCYGFAFAVKDRCDNFRAFGASDINENRISVREFDFPSRHSEHAQMVLLPVPMVGNFRLEHVLHVPSFLDPIHRITLTRMTYLVFPEIRADPDDVQTSQRSVILGVVLHDFIQQTRNAALFCEYRGLSHACTT